MRREDLYLADIADAAAAIARFLRGRSRAGFLDDEILQSAVLQKLIVIGEAATHVSEEFRSAHPSVDWPGIVGFRNIAVHQYFAMDWDIVWGTATRDVPQLRREIAPLLPRKRRRR